MDTTNHADEIKNCTSIDIDGPHLQLETSLGKLIDKLPPISSYKCIYRAPTRLRSVNEKAYTPQVISIGPLHHGKKELQAMEEYKLRYLKAFLDRTGMTLRDCTSVIHDWEEKARNCYAERIDLSSDEFLKIILLDSCFLIEAIVGFVSDSDKVVVPIRCLRRDLLLLENQLPFFILHGLFHLAFPHNPNPLSFYEMCTCYFSAAIVINDQNTRTKNLRRHLASGDKVKHFLDLLRICLLPSTLRVKSTKKAELVAISSASGLQEAGIKFKRGSSDSLLDIKYRVGALEIPKITAYDTLEPLLRNLIALEDCHYPFDSYIIDFVFFMDMLINTPKDVDVLIQSGIIENWLADSSAVATLFNSLGNGNIVCIPNYYFYDISQKLNEHCNVPWNKWKATFKRDYISTPWRTASTIAAIILLLLTFIQTVCSLIPLF